MPGYGKGYRINFLKLFAFYLATIRFSAVKSQEEKQRLSKILPKKKFLARLSLY